MLISENIVYSFTGSGNNNPSFKFGGNDNKSSGKKPPIIIILIAIAVIVGVSVKNSKNNNTKNNAQSVSVTPESAVSLETERKDSDTLTENDVETVVTESVVLQTNLNIENIPNSEFSVDRIEIQKFQDRITEDKERKQYEITTTEAGTYRFEFSDIPQNVWFRLYVYNAGMEELKKGSGDNGDGITISLDADSVYYVVVEQGGNVGSYTLNIGYQKPTVDITNYTAITDSTQYTDQRNIYSFKSKEAGIYRFEFSDVPQNIWFRIYAYNSNMEQLQYGSGDNGDGITIELNENSDYYLVVEQGGNVGSYTLNVGCQKPFQDITGYFKINDSVQYTNQKNFYIFTPSKSEKYRFEFSDMPSNLWLKMYVYNSNMEQLQYGSGDNGDGITIEMNSDSTYYIAVEQGGYTGTYTLNVDIKEE